MRRILKRLHHPIEVTLVCMRWYAANPLSLCHIEEMIAERGTVVDHTTVSKQDFAYAGLVAAPPKARSVGTRGAHGRDVHQSRR